MFFFVAALIFAATFIFQQFHWLTLGGINPNLILVLFQLLVVRQPPAAGSSWSAKVVAALIFAAAALLLDQFGLGPVLALLAVFFISLVLKNFLTGNVFADFSILLLAGGVIFYMAAGFGRWSFLPWTDIALELAYSLLLGLWLIFIFNGETKD